MGKSDEFRAHAEQCRRMADQTINPVDKQAWLRMAESWLRMIRQRKLTASERFDAYEKEVGTGQEKSEESH
jgi:hypothetical protein